MVAGMDHAAIITALGGPSRVAAAIGAPYRVVFRWAHGRAIPPLRWLGLVSLAQQRGVEGVTLERLLRGYYPAKQPAVARSRASRIAARTRARRAPRGSPEPGKVSAPVR